MILRLFQEFYLCLAAILLIWGSLGTWRKQFDQDNSSGILVSEKSSDDLSILQYWTQVSSAPDTQRMMLRCSNVEQNVMDTLIWTLIWHISICWDSFDPILHSVFSMATSCKTSERILLVGGRYLWDSVLYRKAPSSQGFPHSCSTGSRHINLGKLVTTFCFGSLILF